jgi:hypothetical protein
MKQIIETKAALMLFVVFAALSVSAQTGGYDLSHNAIASGGGSSSAGGNLWIDGTAGQPVAGTISTNAS